VVISDDELKEAAPEKSAAIEIQEFVNESQIPTLYFEKPYYLEPDKGAGKAYALLREALAKSGKVGVAQFVLRNRESLCVLKAQGNALTLNTLRFASEIRSADELRLPVNEKLVPNEVNLALKLIEGMTAEFDPAKYHDTYTEDVKKLIEDKAKGQKRQAPPPKPARSNVIDLVAALQESLAQKKPRKRGAADVDQIRRHLSRPPPSTLRTRSTWMAASDSSFLAFSMAASWVGSTASGSFTPPRRMA
jgi:DNA end-binding protein Ku